MSPDPVDPDSDDSDADEPLAHDPESFSFDANSEIHGGKLINLPIEEELKDSYLTYAMSVIVSRAFPTCATGSSPRSGGSW